jgi:hypothetical protein
LGEEKRVWFLLRPTLILLRPSLILLRSPLKLLRPALKWLRPGNYGGITGITGNYGNYGDTLLNPQLLAFRLGPATPRIAADRGGEAIEDGRRGQVN